jgi:hypothetical protein
LQSLQALSATAWPLQHQIEAPCRIASSSASNERLIIIIIIIIKLPN